MTNYYWNNCYRWSNSSWDKYNALPEDTKRALTEGGEKQLWLLKYEKQLGRLWPGLTQPPKSLQIDCKTGNPIDSDSDADADAVGKSDSSDLLNETPFPWEKWSMLPREERETEMNEALKNGDQDDSLRKWHVGNEFREGHLDTSQPDSLTGEATNTENIGGNISWMSPEDRKEVALEFDQDCPAFEFKFNSNPEILSPISLDSLMVTDAYQQQDAPGADLIAGGANQAMDPYQAQREQYEVLA